MKLSRSRRAAVLSVALAMLTSCSAFRAKPDVDIQAVPVSLIFGAKVKPQPTPSTLPNINPSILPPIDIPPPPPPPPPVDPCDEDPYKEGCPGFQLCPPPVEGAAAEKAPTDIHQGDPYEPTGGKYLFSHLQNYSGAEEEVKVTQNDVTSPSPTADGYFFSFYNPINNITMVFQVRQSPPEDAEQEASTTDPGLFLREIKIPPKSDPRGRAYNFGPRDPLRLLTFPINAGDVTEDAQPDFASKRSTQPPTTDPQTGEEILQPSANTLRSHLEVGAIESVEVCAEYALAHKVSWTLDISGDFTAVLTGSFWLATQWGGWPVKDSFIIANSPELIEGNFAESLMRIDPTEFL
jgi:hypothetical protein